MQYGIGRAYLDRALQHRRDPGRDHEDAQVRLDRCRRKHLGGRDEADLDRHRKAAVREQEILDAAEQVAPHPVDDETVGRQQPQSGARFHGLQGLDPGVELLLRQFMLTVPRAYLEAAKIDGCGDFRTMVRVVIPMIKPAIAAVGLFQFFYCWNDYFGPQIYVSENPAAWTLSYGLGTFKSAHHTNWNLTMAATLMVMAPVVIVFFLAQKAFVEGVTLTGVKG